jgi:hypothetical protein
MQASKQNPALITVMTTSLLVLLLTGCATTQTADNCAIKLRPDLSSAIQTAETRLSSGCEYSFDNYFDQLLAIATENPASENKRLFSDFLVSTSSQGIISKRQARNTYNRFFNVKFVSLTGEYNTCSQTCPVRDKVLADMQSELSDKELGLVRASEDNASYYRSDHLLKEAQIVLEATCRACEAGGI